jgi:hypothetical protein
MYMNVLSVKIGKGYLLFFGFVFTTLSFFSQSSFIEGFSADASSSGVLLRWTILSGNTCNGTRIYRSEDGLYFNQIGAIDGICGSPTESLNYSFVDQNPLPNIENYYRLDLVGIGFSEIIQTTFFVISSNGYLLFPNPSAESNRLVFQNPSNQRMKLEVLDIFGNIIHRNETNNNSFVIPSASFSVGIYYFKLIEEDETKVINGKFEVAGK